MSPQNLHEPLQITVMAAAEECLTYRALLRQAAVMLYAPADYDATDRALLVATIHSALNGGDVRVPAPLTKPGREQDEFAQEAWCDEN